MSADKVTSAAIKTANALWRVNDVFWSAHLGIERAADAVRWVGDKIGDVGHFVCELADVYDHRRAAEECVLTPEQHEQIVAAIERRENGDTR